ncbi:MAG: AAA family ATPase [Butyrivibrio sp.]|nr:AAA family ATPase [Butyrivibrio sp.]
MAGFDNILDDVAKDFFGPASNKFKESLISDDLKKMAQKLDRAGVTSSDTVSSKDSDVPEALRKATEALNELDQLTINNTWSNKGKTVDTQNVQNTLVEQEQSDAAKQTETDAKKEEEPEKTGMEQLDELIGLENIKSDVKELVSFVKIQKLRKDKGNKAVPVSLHLVFNGNPGTGKTTIARILAKLYKEIGILSKGQLVEVDRSGLVAGFVGQTATKTQEKIQQAMGGILFIDEAYTLAKEGNDFGQEAIDTILKAMEDHRDDFIVIVAGYTEPMEKFIESNPGLKSRFNKYINFPDYTLEELIKIFDMNCNKYGYCLSDGAREYIEKVIAYKIDNKDDNFANAREIRNLFEAIITNQATRVAELSEPTDEQLNTIEKEDMKEFKVADPAPDNISDENESKVEEITENMP